MTSSIFLQIEPNKFVLGTGILNRSGTPSQGKPSFYVNDFFLDSKTPWLIPDHVEIVDALTMQAFAQSGALGECPVTWTPPSQQQFHKTFDEIQHLIKDGVLQKAVPMIFETGALEGYAKVKDSEQAYAGELLKHFAQKLLKHLHANLFLYGFSEGDEGMIGLSPELLFTKTGPRIISAALAGTQSADELQRSLKNQKDMSEHNFVVRDLMEKLSSLGHVQSQETSTYNIGSLVHLRTPLATTVKNDVSFASVVETLHPSAALGTYPSTAEAARFLRHDNETSPRKMFAAPVGVQFPNGDGTCIAAIRCVQWNGDTIRIGSGCGIVEESIVDSEWRELAMKRESIKQRLWA